jgi:hypothetical protein
MYANLVRAAGLRDELEQAVGVHYFSSRDFRGFTFARAAEVAAANA